MGGCLSESVEWRLCGMAFVGKGCLVAVIESDASHAPRHIILRGRAQVLAPTHAGLPLLSVPHVLGKMHLLGLSASQLTQHSSLPSFCGEGIRPGGWGLVGTREKGVVTPPAHRGTSTPVRNIKHAARVTTHVFLPAGVVLGAGSVCLAQGCGHAPVEARVHRAGRLAGRCQGLMRLRHSPPATHQVDAALVPSHTLELLAFLLVLHCVVAKNIGWGRRVRQGGGALAGRRPCLFP